MGEDFDARLAGELLGTPPKARLYRLQDVTGEVSWVAELEDGRHAFGDTRMDALRNLRAQLRASSVAPSYSSAGDSPGGA
jgi:hypothetical protein